MTISISRNADKKLIKKSINNSATPKVANVSLIGSTSALNLDNVFINGTSISLNKSSLDYLNISSVGTAEANKALVVDSERNISNINNIECEKLYVDNTLVTGIIASGISNSPYLNNINYGIAEKNKVLSSDTSLNSKCINNVTADNIMLNSSSIKLTENDVYTRSGNFNKAFTEVSSSVINNGIKNFSNSCPPVVTFKLNNLYISLPFYSCSAYGGGSSITNVTTTFEYGTSLSDMTSLTLTVPSNAIINTFSKSSFAYSPTLNLYVIAVHNATVTSSHNTSFFYGSSLSSLTLVQNPFAAGNVGTTGAYLAQTTVYWSTSLNAFITIAMVGGAVNLYTSTNGSTWTLWKVILTSSEVNNYVLYWLEGKGYLIASKTAFIYKSSGNLSSSALTLYTTSIGNVSYQCRAEYFDTVNNNYFIYWNGFLMKTNDFLNWTNSAKLVYVGVGSSYCLNTSCIEGNSEGTKLYIQNALGVVEYDIATEKSRLLSLFAGVLYLENKFIRIIHSANTNNGIYAELNYNPDNILANEPINTVTNFSPNSFFSFKSLGNSILSVHYAKSKKIYYIVGNIYSKYVSQSFNYLYISKDLIDFTPIFNLSGYQQYKGVMYYEKMNAIILYGPSTSYYIYSLDNGVTWVNGPTWSANTISMYVSPNTNYLVSVSGGSICYTRDLVINYILSYGTKANYDKYNGFYIDYTKSSATTSVNLFLPYNEIYVSGSKQLFGNIFSSISTNGLYTISVTSGTYGDACFSDNGNILMLTATTSALISALSSMYTHTTPVVQYGIINNGAWCKPVWIPSIKMFVTLDTNTGASNNVLAYSSNGVSWKYHSIKHTITFTGIGLENLLHYDDVTGYLYIYSIYGCLVSKVSVYGNEIELDFIGSNNLTEQIFKKPEYSITDWKRITGLSANGSINWKDICYGYGKYIMVGLNTITYFDNIYNLTTYTLSGDWKSMAYNNSTYLLVGTNLISYSTDGINWNTNTSYTYPWKKVFYSPEYNYFIAVGLNCILTSSNGTSISVTERTGDWNSVTYGNGKFVVVGNGNSILVGTDENISSWSNVTFVANIKSITYGNGYFVVCMTNSIAYSTNATNWTTVTLTGTWNNIQYSEDLKIFMLVGTNNSYISSNLTKWVSLVYTGNINSLVWSYRLNTFIGVGDNNFINYAICLNTGLDNSCITNHHLGATGYITSNNISSVSLGYSNLSNTSGDFVITCESTAKNAIKMTNTLDGTTSVIKHSGLDNIDISIDGIVDIPTHSKFGAKGLYLGNQVKLNATASDLNYLAGLNKGVSSANKALSTKSDGSVDSINTLNVNNLILNNTLYMPNINDTRISSATAGTSNPSTALIVDSNKSITNLNKVSTNKELFIGNTKIVGSGVNKTAAIISAGSFTKNYGKKDYFRDMASNDNIYTKLPIVTYIAIPNITATANTVNSSIPLLLSYDGINWSTYYTGIVGGTGLAICYTTDRFILLTSTASQSTKIYISFDGLTWYPSVYNSSIPTSTLSTYINSNYTIKSTSSIVAWYASATTNQKVLFGGILSSSTFANTAFSFCSYGGFCIIGVTPSNFLNMISTNNFFSGGNPQYSGASLPAGTWKDVDINSQYTNGRIVVVGSAGKIAYSIYSSQYQENPGLFTAVTLDTTVNFVSVAWSDYLQKFIAVGNSGTPTNRIYYSSNGSTWTSYGVNLNNISWNTLKVCNDKTFLLTTTTGTGYDNHVFYVDSNNTVQSKRAFYDHIYGNTVYVPSLSKYFIAINEFTSLSSPKILKSLDGLNWEDTTYLSTKPIIYMQYSSSLQLIVGCTSTGIVYSTDGETWTTAVDSLYTTAPYCMKWIPELEKFFVGSTNKIYYSNNGLVWNSVLTSGESLGYFSYSPTLNILLGMSGANGKNVYSLDGGLTWNLMNYIGSGTQNVSCRNILWNTKNNTFVSYSSGAYVSADGLNWSYTNTLVYDSVSNNQIMNDVVYVPSFDKYVSVTYDANTNSSSYLITSDDGVIWSAYSFNNSTGVYKNIMYNPTKDIILISRNATTVTGNAFYICDLKEYYNKINNEIDLSEIAEYIQVTQEDAISSVTNWKPYTHTHVGTTIGKIKWLPNRGMFCWINRTSTTTNILYSTNGLQWSPGLSGTNNVTDICDINKRKNDTYFLSNNFIYYNSVGGNYNTAPTYSSYGCSSQYMYFSYKYDLILLFKSTTSDKISLTGHNNITYADRITLPSSIVYGCMDYSSELDIFIILPSSATNTFFYSSNIYEWNTGTLPISTGGFVSIAYSNKLKIFIAGTNNGNILYSTNGIDWTLNSTYTDTIAITQVSYILDLEMFIMSSSISSVNSLYYSFDGITWTSILFSSAVSIYSFDWSPKLACFCAVTNVSSFMVSVPVLQRAGNALLTQNIPSSVTSADTINDTKYHHINTPNGPYSRGSLQQNTYSSADYHLLLNHGNAYKPTTSTWTISSDERIKENIELADLDICYNNIKNLPLKKYKWKDEYIEESSIDDKNILGWIAQEVQQYYPNSISISKVLDVEDCLHLNTDQIISALYGTIQKLSQKNNTNDLKLKLLLDKIKIMKDKIKEFE